MVKIGGNVRRDLARAVVDASGTWATPNPLGASGLLAVGEAEYSDRIAYGIPDILGRDRHLYAGRKTLVVGSGHSAANALLELAELTKDEADVSLLWATRTSDLARNLQRWRRGSIAGSRRTRRQRQRACRSGSCKANDGILHRGAERGAGWNCCQG